MEIEKLVALVDQETAEFQQALAAGRKGSALRHLGALQAYSKVLSLERAEQADLNNRWKHCEWHPPERPAAAQTKQAPRGA